MLGSYHLNSLFEILNRLHFIYDPERLWQFIVEQACSVLQCEAGTFYELDEEAGELRATAASGMAKDRLKEITFKVGVGISGWVARYHQPALVNDVAEDHRFSGAVDQITGFKTKSVLCIPVFSVKRTFGVIEVFNRKAGLFEPQDQEFMTLLARQAAIACQNFLLLAEVQRKEQLVQSLIESLSGGLVAMNPQGKILFVNGAAIRLLALDGGPFEGNVAAHVLSEYPRLLTLMQETLDESRTVSRQEMRLFIQGSEERVGYTTLLITGPQKEKLGAGVIFQKL